MLRIEIVVNQSLEENLFEALKDEKAGKYYTMYRNVHGVGSSGPRMGDAIWPEENFAMVIWCDVEEAKGIVRAVRKVKKQFPDEGIKLFGLPERPKAQIQQPKQQTQSKQQGQAQPKQPAVKPAADSP